MNISFIPGSSDIQKMVEPPLPSKIFIPEWYKKLGQNNVKKCMPFLDSMTNGYIQKTWCDIEISNKDNKFTINFDSDISPASFRPISEMPFSDTYYKVEFVWHRPWAIVLPSGFSAIIVHPLNRYDLPFVTLSGIVDLDQPIQSVIGNIPFYLKKNFVGIIPKNTPMFQIIPIKREDWISSIEAYQDEFFKEKLALRENKPDFYKKFFWNRKKFD